MGRMDFKVGDRTSSLSKAKVLASSPLSSVQVWLLICNKVIQGEEPPVCWTAPRTPQTQLAQGPTLS